MSRPKKSDSKAKDKGPARSTLEIDVDSYKSTRDQVVRGLATIQDVIKSLSESYIRITNKVLGEYGAELEITDALSKINDNPLLKQLEGAHHLASPAAAAEGSATRDPDKKEKKKRIVDPNAPKRPLTAFFLYMKTARPIIAEEMGADAKPKAVSDEGTVRWAAMSPESKQVWQNYYKDNLRLYNARVHAYKVEGDLLAKDMTDDDALVYADAHHINAESAEAQLATENAAAHVVEDVAPDSTPVPAGSSKSKGSRKSKGATVAKDSVATATGTATATGAATGHIVPPKSAAIEKAEKEKAEKEKPTTDKKRKRSTTAAASKTAAAEKNEEEILAVETPKAAPKSKKRKSKATDA